MMNEYRMLHKYYKFGLFVQGQDRPARPAYANEEIDNKG